jgi:Nif11 domain
MAIEAVVQFLEATAQDDALRQGLAGIIGTGDGDISSAQALDQEEAGALLGQRSVLVTTFAEQSGYAFTVAELKAVIGVFQRYKAGELSEVEFSNALGLDSASKLAANQLASLGKTVGMVFLGVKYDVTKDTRSAHQVLDFMKKTAQDAEFRKQLKDILNVGDGDISDFSALDADEVQALTGSRGALVAEFAARAGFLFTMSDLLAVTDAFQRVQSGELTSEEFDKFLSLNVKSKEFFPFIENVVSMTYKGFNYSNAVASKSQDNTLAVVRFMERSESDMALRSQLASLLGGDGNISNPAELDAEEASALGSDRSQQIVQLGAEHGFRFTASDLAAVVGAFQLVNGGELSMESCTRILGLGKSQDGLASVEKAAGRIYRGIRY